MTKSSLLKRLQQHAANAATPVQVAVEETPAASTEVLSPEVVVQNEPQPQPAPTPVVAEVPKATPVVAKPQPQVQKTEIPSYKRVETGKKKMPKNIDINDLKKVLDIPMIGIIQEASFVEVEEKMIISNMTASTECGRRNVIPLDHKIATQIVEILKTGASAVVNVTSKNDIHIVTTVHGSTKTTSIEGKSFSGFNQITQWILNQMATHGIAATPENINAAMEKLIVVNTGNGFVVLNKTNVTNVISSTTAIAGPDATNPATTAAIATGSVEGVATGVTTTTVATTATTTGK